MRLIDVDQAKEQINQMETLKPSERMLFRMVLERTPTYEPPNPPLTLEELREMDGEPVWVIHPQNKFEPCWMLVMVRCNFVLANWQVCNFSDYGHTWLAYRRKPEEGTT